MRITSPLITGTITLALLLFGLLLLEPGTTRVGSVAHLEESLGHSQVEADARLVASPGGQGSTRESLERTEVSAKESTSWRILVLDEAGKPCAGIPVGVRRKPSVGAHKMRPVDLALGSVVLRHTEFTETLAFDVIPSVDSSSGRLLTGREVRVTPQVLTSPIRFTSLDVQQGVRLKVNVSGENVQLSGIGLSFTGLGNEAGEVPYVAPERAGLSTRGYFARGETDENGVFSFRGSDEEELLSGFAFPTREDVWKSFPEPETPGPRSLTLRLPPLDRFEITVHDDLMNADQRSFDVRVVQGANGPEELLEALGPFRSMPSTDGLRPVAIVLAERGSVGSIQLRANAAFAAIEDVPLHPAPEEDGVTRLTVRTSSLYALCTGHLLMSTGIPLAKRLVDVRLRAGFLDPSSGAPLDGEEVAQHSLMTDEQGRLTFLLPPAHRPMHYRYLELEAHHDLRSSPYSPIRPTTICDFTADLLPGTTFDFGPLTFDDGPLLAQGIVVDSSGTPLPGVSISCTPRSEHRNRSGKVQQQLSSTDGRFTFRGLTPHTNLHLVAKHEGYIGVVTQVPPSSDPVRLVLQRAGSLGIRCVPGSFEHLWKRGRLTLVLEQDAGEMKKRIQHQLKSPDSVVPNLDPGLWNVTLSLHGDRLATFPKVQISPGEVARPVFLQGLSLANWTHILTVRVVDENGVPRKGVGLVLSASQEGRRFKTPRYSTNAKGEETYVVPVAFAEITVLPDGGKPMRIPNATGVQVLSVPAKR